MNPDWVCPNFIGPGRLVGQLRAVVLQLWDPPICALDKRWYNMDSPAVPVIAELGF
jgi:hypothetical protein